MDRQKLEEKQHELLHQEMLRGWDRQTQAFSFIIVLYAGALAAVGAIVKEPTAWAVGIALLIMSFSVPTVVFPIMCLFVDIEMYNSAVDRELTESDQYGVRHCGREAIKKLKIYMNVDLDSVANNRLKIFVVGPLLGLVASFGSLIWLSTLGFPTDKGFFFVAWLGSVGVFVDAYLLYRSVDLMNDCRNVRNWSANAKLPTKPEIDSGDIYPNDIDVQR